MEDQEYKDNNSYFNSVHKCNTPQEKLSFNTFILTVIILSIFHGILIPLYYAYKYQNLYSLDNLNISFKHPSSKIPGVYLDVKINGEFSIIPHQDINLDTELPKKIKENFTFEDLYEMQYGHKNKEPQPYIPSTSSGFIVSCGDQRLLVTNNHVMANIPKEIRTTSSTNEKMDIAVVNIDQLKEGIDYINPEISDNKLSDFHNEDLSDKIGLIHGISWGAYYVKIEGSIYKENNNERFFLNTETSEETVEIMAFNGLSGAPVIDKNTGHVIGIIFAGGCDSVNIIPGGGFFPSISRDMCRIYFSGVDDIRTLIEEHTQTSCI